MSDVSTSDSLRQRSRETFRLSRLAIRLTWQAGPWLLIGIVSILILAAILAPLQLALGKAVVDRAAFDLGFSADAPAALGSPSLLVWIALAAAALVLSLLLEPVSQTLQSLVGDRLTHHITERLLQATNRWQGIARFEDPEFADHLRRARERASWGGLHLILLGAEAALCCFTAATLAVVLTALHPIAAPFLILAAIPQVVYRWDYSHRTGSHIYGQTAASRRLEYYRDATLSPELAKDVRLFNLGPFFTRRYDDTFAEVRSSLDLLRRRLTGRMVAAEVLTSLSAALAYLYVVRQIAGGSLTLGDLALYGGATTLFQQQINGIGFFIGFLPTPLQFLPSLVAVFDAPPDLPQPEAVRSAPNPIRQGLVFDHVAFTYPSAAEPTLRDVSFTIHPHGSLALVGHNGAGKTTIVKLLLRLYDPTSGRITLDGIDLRDFDLNDLRAKMAVIFQDFVRFELTAAENIALGDLAALQDVSRLRAAAAKSGAADLIDSLPDGFATLLGREFGVRDLSGGEWQKIALARAFVRDAPILVLDEPTASLDIQTEHDVYSRFHDLTRDRMTLLISHRFSTVRMADRIVFLRDGRSTETGSHADLMAQNGDYARLYTLQAAHYARDPDIPIATAPPFPLPQRGEEGLGGLGGRHP